METANKTNQSAQTSSLEATYLEERIQGQLTYYGDKSRKNKNWYHTSRIVVIISGALIPLCVGYSETWEVLKYVTGALGVLVALSEGLSSLKKWKDNWFTYRLTAERLQREQFLYQNGVGVYRTEEDPFKTFVERAEQIMDSENSTWVNYRGKDGAEEEKK